MRYECEAFKNTNSHIWEETQKIRILQDKPGKLSDCNICQIEPGQDQRDVQSFQAQMLRWPSRSQICRKKRRSERRVQVEFTWRHLLGQVGESHCQLRTFDQNINSFPLSII